MLSYTNRRDPEPVSLADIERELATVSRQMRQERELIHFLIDRDDLSDILAARRRRVEALKLRQSELAAKIACLKMH